MLKNREILLTELQHAKSAKDSDAVKEISKNLEDIQNLIDKFLPELRENINIELHHLQKLHEHLDPGLETEH